MKRGKRYLYIATSMDQYELPIAVAESISELANMIGKSKYTILHSIKRYEDGILDNTHYHKVEIDDTEE